MNDVATTRESWVRAKTNERLHQLECDLKDLHSYRQKAGLKLTVMTQRKLIDDAVTDLLVLLEGDVIK